MTRVLVVPFDLDDRQGLLAVLARQIPRRLGLTCAVELAPDVDLTGCFSGARRQYDALAVLEALAPLAGKGRVLGITAADLFLSVFTHILGAAQLGGAAAVVATHRLRAEAVGLPPDPALVEERLIKEVVHEIGHTFGLRHCQDPGCAMFAANNPDEVDLKGPDFCGKCLRSYHGSRAAV